MVSALVQLVPLAIAAAMSSVPLTATILILLSPQRGRSALPFLIGWVGGMALIVLAATLGAGALPTPELQPAGWGFALLEVVAGLALVVYALIAAIRAIRKPRLSSTNRWLAAVSSFGPRPAFGLAVALNFRPKGVLVAVAAGLAVAGASLAWADQALLIAAYLVVAVSTVAVPIVVTLLAPGRTEPTLVALRDWLERNGAVVTAVVMGVIGVVVACAGLAGFFR